MTPVRNVRATSNALLKLLRVCFRASPKSAGAGCGPELSILVGEISEGFGARTIQGGAGATPANLSLYTASACGIPASTLLSALHRDKAYSYLHACSDASSVRPASSPAYYGQGASSSQTLRTGFCFSFFLKQANFSLLDLELSETTVQMGDNFRPSQRRAIWSASWGLIASRIASGNEEYNSGNHVASSKGKCG